jgi:hypothetical protein
MVREADAYALVTDVAAALALRGHPARITAANGPRLVRLGALMIDAFCTARETTEENDGKALHQNPG